MSKVIFFLSLIWFSSYAQQPLTCSARQYPPTTVRVEGYTELLGDMVVACTGGTPTAAGSSIPFVDITLTVGVPITNRKGPNETFIDALLMLDEPHSVANPNVPLVPCVSCAAPLGNGSGRGVYNGSTGYPNVFQGELMGGSTVRFRVPFDPPGSGVERIVRVANVRVNGTRMVGVVPNTVVGTLNVPGAAMSPGTQILGIAHRALRIATAANNRSGFSTTAPAKLYDCPGGVGIVGGDPEQPNLVLQLEEQTRDGLRARNVAQDQFSGPAGAFGSFFSPDLNQNVVGYPYGTESGVFAGASGSPPRPVPQIGFSTPFDPNRGLDRAGLATHGTRFYIRFTNTGNLAISMPVSLVFGVLPIGSFSRADRAAPTRAILIQGDSTASSANFSPVAGNTKGFARIPNIGSTATAVYEVVSADASSLDFVSIPVFVEQQRYTDQGKVMISVGLGPSSDITGPDASAPIPRFAPDIADTIEGFVYEVPGCSSVQDAAVTVSSASGTRGGPGTMTILYRNASTAAIPGLVTVDVALPPGFTATSIGGFEFACTLQPLRCTVRGDRFGEWSINVSFTIPANASAIVPLSASVIATGDQLPSNNSSSLELRAAAPVNFTISTLGVDNEVLLSADGVYNISQTRIFASPGTTITVSTIANQYSSDGTLWVFKSWGDNGALTHGYVIPNPDSFGNVAGLGALFEATQRNDSLATCVANAGVPPLVASTEKTAGVGDFVLYCSGGIPTPAGTPVPKVDIRLSLGSVLTSRTVFPGVSEALLIVDEPHSSTNPNVPLLPCGASGSGGNANGICFNTAAGSATYSGTAGRPNVFQGVFDGTDSILFSQVPFDPPGTTLGGRIFRITNLRADFSLLPISWNLIPTYTQATVKMTPSNAAWISGKTQVVAFAQKPVRVPFVPSVGLPQCLGRNAQIASDPSKALDSGPGNGAQVNVVIAEEFPGVFQPKNHAIGFANAPGLTSISYPADTKQNVPGVIFNAQTLFYAGPGAEPNLGSLWPYGSPILPTADFPAFRGLSLAGKADSGTRIAVRFSGIPTGVKIFVPVRISTTSTITGGATGIAHLTSADGAGAGAFSIINGNASGLAPLTITSAGEASAIYEILRADPFTQERLSIPLAFAYAAGQPSLGTIRATVGLAPFVATPGNATDAAGVIPRFSGPLPDPRPIASVQTCEVPDLQLTMTRSGPRSSTGSTTYRFDVTNVGRVVSTGPQTLSLSGSPITSLSGVGWTCSVPNRTCTRSDSLLPGASYPRVTMEVGPSAENVSYTGASLVTREQNQSNDSMSDYSTVVKGGQTFVPLQTPCRLVDTRQTTDGPVLRLQTRTFELNGRCQLPAADSPSAPTAYALNVTVVPKSTLGYLTVWPSGQEQPFVSTLNSLDGRVKANAAIIPAGANGSVSVFATDDAEVILDVTGYFANSGGLDFVPMIPCRVVDTRNPTGTYGGPALVPLASRPFSISLALVNTCGRPLAKVFSMNATVVPSGPFGYLTLFNPNFSRPTVSTLNAVTGAITANALLIGGSDSGSNTLGEVSAFATEPAHLLLDVNGYFRSSPPSLKYYPIQPCRLVDTRNPNGPFGGPALVKAADRVFDFPAGGCGIPANARSFAVNATVVPSGPFGFLTIWGAGMARPTVSTLNALDGAITSNAAIVSDAVGGEGKIAVYASDAVHLILDVNGYFAP